MNSQKLIGNRDKNTDTLDSSAVGWVRGSIDSNLVRSLPVPTHSFHVPLFMYLPVATAQRTDIEVYGMSRLLMGEPLAK